MLTVAGYHPPQTPLEKLVGDYNLTISHPGHPTHGPYRILRENGFIVALWHETRRGVIKVQVGAGDPEYRAGSLPEDWREVALYCVQRYVGDGRSAA